MPSADERKGYRYYDLLMAAFVTILLCSNLIGAGKVTTVWGVTFGTGIFFFPFSYIFGDILTEVYGYARSRKVVWTGFAAMTFASFMAWFILRMPAAQGWRHQAAYEIVFGTTSRIVLASLMAFWAGEFSNSYVLAKMKIFTEGRFLWMRTIGSTIVGEAIDSIIFYPVAFIGLWPMELVIKVMISNYVIKVLWEGIMTPLTYKVVNFLKRVEHEDYYDRHTDFNPFLIRE